MGRVLMYPTVKSFGKSESGIRRVIEAYDRYLPRYGWQVTDDENNFDISAVHAGTASRPPDIAHCHGLYWSADYTLEPWAWYANKLVLEGVRHAQQVTVPSRWVQEVFQKELRMSPHVIPHGIDWWDYEPKFEGHYVLWNKNRAADVCDPTPISVLATKAPDVHFVSTFSNATLKNLKVIGVQDHASMMAWLGNCSVYLATTKETAGIGILEAMAMGKPVLGYAHGGILDFVAHGINGYLARPGDTDDLLEGLRFCLANQRELGENSRDLVKRWTWDKAVEKLARVYDMCLEPEDDLVTVVIPCHNKASTIRRAIASVMAQGHDNLECFVLNDRSTDDSEKIILDTIAHDSRFHYVKVDYGNVALVRNHGLSLANGAFYCCLDGDDWLDPLFLEACVPALIEDRSLGIAYTGLTWHKPDGSTGLSPWPGEYDFDKQLKKQNQVPTCHVGRVEMWRRLGGQRARYTGSQGAGAEDAEFVLRAGAYGWPAKKVTEAGLFHYSWMSGLVSGNKQYQEKDWLYWHPWTHDDLHPMASAAKPRRHSHPVRQQDEPAISVIVPVGPTHTESIVDVLDSLEAQTFRRWEVCVADDSYDGIPEWIYKAYPYMRVVSTGGGKGAGYARNRAVEISRGPLIFPVDADDWIHPPTLETLLNAWSKTGAATYSDYYGVAFIDDPSKLAGNIKLISRDEKTGESLLSYRAADYDRNRAILQPEEGKDPYLWANVSVLMPRRWWDEAGGMDETMPSYEDVDLLWRMARMGRCFCRVPEPLLVYRFASGTRRDSGYKMRHELLEYLKVKYEREFKSVQLQQR